MKLLPTALLTLALFSAGCTQPEAAPRTPATPTATVQNLDATVFKQLAEQKKGIYLDVRTPGEVARGRLPNASVIDINDARFEQKVGLMQKDRPIFVYCASGRRSSAAAEMMVRMGFKDVSALNGGIMAWGRAGLPVETSPEAPVADGASAMKPEALDALVKSERRVLVDYHTKWCAPCRAMAPVVDALAEKWKGKAKVVRVDIEQSEALAAREKIEGVPVFVIYVDGKERWRKSGELPGELLEAELAKP